MLASDAHDAIEGYRRLCMYTYFVNKIYFRSELFQIQTFFVKYDGAVLDQKLLNVKHNYL